MPSADESYWADYNSLQQAKHQLLESYLAAWFPILSSFQGKVLYIDCHAGRGRHDTGHAGSPIRALRILVEHRSRAKILAGTEVYFLFFEENEYNYNTLQEELEKLGTLPSNVFVLPILGDYEAQLRTLIGGIKSRGASLAPSFAFIDPYGFSISMDLMNEILSFPTTELLITFMYRFVDMATRHDDQAENMDRLFGTTNWRQLPRVQDPRDRSETTINLFSNQLQAKYVTHMYFRAANGALKYTLFHASNHRRGRQKMKDAFWTVTPDGSFTVSERHSPDQQVLIVPEPDMRPLEDAIWNEFQGRSIKVKKIHDWLLDQVYKEKHLHQILRRYRNSGIVEVTEYEPPFSFKQNPSFKFPSERP